MNLSIVTHPTVEPVTLEDTKLWIGEVPSNMDGIITMLIQAAREYGENYTRRAFCTQLLELQLDEFPYDAIFTLPRPPLQFVESVKYTDVDGVEQTVLGAEYQVDLYAGRIMPVYGAYWPAIRTDFNPVKIRYSAGYPESGSPTTPEGTRANVPAGIRGWILRKVAQLYEHREEIITGTIAQPVPRSGVDALLDRYVADMTF